MEDKLLAFAFLSPYVFWNMPFDFSRHGLRKLSIKVEHFRQNKKPQALTFG